MNRIMKFIMDTCEDTVRMMCIISKCACNHKVMMNLLNKLLFISIAMLTIAGVVYYAFDMKALSYGMIIYTVLNFAVVATGVRAVKNKEYERMVDEMPEEVKEYLSKMF